MRAGWWVGPEGCACERQVGGREGGAACVSAPDRPPAPPRVVGLTPAAAAGPPGPPPPLASSLGPQVPACRVSSSSGRRIDCRRWQRKQQQGGRRFNPEHNGRRCVSWRGGRVTCPLLSQSPDPPISWLCKPQPPQHLSISHRQHTSTSRPNIHTTPHHTTPHHTTPHHIQAPPHQRRRPPPHLHRRVRARVVGVDQPQRAGQRSHHAVLAHGAQDLGAHGGGAGAARPPRVGLRGGGAAVLHQTAHQLDGGAELGRRGRRGRGGRRQIGRAGQVREGLVHPWWRNIPMSARVRSICILRGAGIRPS